MIINLNQAEEISITAWRAGQKIGLCHGVFDLMHAGHVEHFSLSKMQCDLLFVAVSPDKYSIKGPNRPIYNQFERSKIIDTLKVVDYVICDEWFDETACTTISKVKPNLYFKGTEYRDQQDFTGNIRKEIDLVRRHGGDISYTSGKIFSSSRLISDFFGNKSMFKNIKSASYYLDLVNRIFDIRVGVIGEGILDEYISVTSLGSANKYPILSVREEDFRVDRGGSFAVHNLVSVLAKSNLMSQDGDCPFARGCIKKTRYVDKDKLNKLFEVNNRFKIEIDELMLKNYLNGTDIDVLLICDFGHGLFNENVLKIISDKNCSKFVMSQHNSGNQYKNFPWKYQNVAVDGFCMNEKEMIVNSCETDIRIASKSFFEKMSPKKCLFVTLGKNGSLCYDGSTHYQVPSIDSVIKDTIGCGDVFFAISSLVMYLTGIIEDALVMGNIFAYLHAQTDGNSSVVTRNDFVRFVRGFLG